MIQDGQYPGVNYPYELYQSKHSYLRTFDQERWDKSDFSDWTETRGFKLDQVQESMFSKNPDLKWELTRSRKDQLA